MRQTNSSRAKFWNRRCSIRAKCRSQVVGTKFVLYKHSDQEKKESGARSGKKKNPVKAGIRARRQAMKKQREARNEYFRNAAVQAAIEKRKARMEEND